ncbi:MAG: hypothetical protein M1831_000478 [Alyxoria varia]|nr:MAG: hypothetical protein M1831_000478 [Alyxoria varia]
MQYYNFLPTTFLLAALVNIPTALADECAAIGHLNTNAAGGFAGGGGAVTSGSYIEIFRGDKKIGSYEPGDTDDPVCSDQIGISSELPSYFLWGANCSPTSFE